MPFLTNSSPQTHYPNNTILFKQHHKLITKSLKTIWTICIYVGVDIIENKTIELQCNPSQNHLPIHCIKTISTHKHHTQSQHTQTSHNQKTHKHKKTCSIKWHKSDFRQAAQSQCKHMSKHSLNDNTQTKIFILWKSNYILTKFACLRQGEF